MSLPWNKTIRLRIGAQQVQGTLHPAWSPRRTLTNSQHAAEPGTSAGAAPAPFATAMAATLSELGAAQNSSVKSAQVLMADARVHFDVVEGDYAHLSERQLQSVAQACVAEILGDRALVRTVRWQLQKDSHHLLIAAIVSSDIDLVEELSLGHGIEQLSVQPAFCWHWNHHASALTQTPAVFATASEDHISAVLVLSGSITAISCGSIQAKPNGAAEAKNSKNAQSVKNDIDDRVDRLLSSVGLDPSLVQSYLLVTPQAAGQNLDARWQVVLTESEAV